MTDSSGSGVGKRLALIIGITVVVAVAVVALRWSRGDFGTQGASERVSEGRGQTERSSSRRLEPGKAGKASTPQGPRTRKTAFAFDHSLEQLVKSKGRFNPPRPLRFLVSYGSSRSKQEARRIAEDARRSFLAGEKTSYQLIRERSDPPRGIPQELLSRYEKLPPTEASPVVEGEGAFYLFFGAPTEAPENLSSPPGAPAPAPAPAPSR